MNVRPLKWHSNTILHLSVDELRDIFEHMGFVVKNWLVDTIPIGYWNDDQKVDGNTDKLG